MVVVGAVVLIDTAFYAVVTPLLPSLSHRLHLSKLGAGILAGAYPAGMLVASLPTGLLAVRIGPRRVVCLGLTLMALSTVLFGLLNTAVTLDLVRFVEGVAGACSWAGGLAWLVAAAPVERRGATIGAAVGSAIFGAMLGPVLGALATAIGRGLLFSLVGAVGFGLALGALTLPDLGAQVPGQRIRAIVPLFTRPAGLAAMWLVALPAVATGALVVLGSLRLSRLGGSATLIAGTYLVSAALAAAMAPAIGRLSDRLGRLAPLRGGAVLAAVGLAAFTLPGAPLPLAGLIVITGLGIDVFWAPAMALLSDVADGHRIEQGLAAALMNLAWAVGQIVGDVAGGGLGKAVGDGLPTGAVAVVCVATVVGAGRALATKRFGVG